MKKLIFIILFCCCSTFIFSQTWNKFSDEYIENDSLRSAIEKQKKIFNQQQKSINWNFISQDGKVYWQKVFEHSPSDTLAVKRFFDSNPLFTKNQNSYTAEIILTEYTNEPNMNIPFILHSPAKMIFHVQFKEDRYRVTVENITWSGNAGTTGTITITQSVGLSMQDLISKQGKFKANGCKHTNICLLNLFYFNSKYQSKKNVLNTDF